MKKLLANEAVKTAIKGLVLALLGAITEYLIGYIDALSALP